MQRHLLAFYKVAKYRDNAPLRKLCILQIKVLVTRTVSHHVVNKINITHAAHDEMVAYVLVLNIQQLSCILIDRIFYRMV